MFYSPPPLTPTICTVEAPIETEKGSLLKGGKGPLIGTLNRQGIMCDTRKRKKCETLVG